jgi:hypothetical protein
LKKQERAKEIRKRAYEYAKSGEHHSWLSIEHQISSECLYGAKSVLDNQLIREELNALCKEATSSEEIKRKEQFQTWLKETIRDVTPILKISSPEVSLTFRGMILYINGLSFSFEIGRKFGSNELEITREFEVSGSQRYRMTVPERLRGSDFRSINGKQVINLIEKLIGSKK